MPKTNTPFLWTLFSIGGTVAAMLYPAHIFLQGIAIPIGWVQPVGYDSILSLVKHPLTRLYLFVFIAFPLFHGAHRFRYTLYDGLKLKHLTTLIAVICYGSALVATLLAAYTLLRL